MAKKIWMLSFRNCVGFQGTAFVCKESVSFAPGSCGVTLVYDGVNTGIGEISAFASIVTSTNRSQCPAGYPFYADEAVGCITGIDPVQPCDCINGGCVPKTTYGTPGIFASLAACQSGCAKNSTCTGECVDPAEIANLKQAIDTLQSKICK